ncbi:MAG: hypothetical protein AB9915_00765 [Candidatus Dojkabacteria bacterium]
MSKIRELLSRPKVRILIPVLFFFLWFVFFFSFSFIRDSRLDENIYLAESATIANLLKSGQWIGDYGVGLHGFVSKFFLGVIFVFTGPSVFLATLSNVILSILSGVIFYKILHKNFNFSMIYSLLGVVLLFSSYQFVTYTPTFYRDIGALFWVLVILEAILNKRSRLLTGFYFLLLLDAKEHVFYTLVPALVLWIGIESFIIYRKKIYLVIKNIFKNLITFLLPSIFFLVLMFSTSLVPLNIYNGNILGLIQGGTSKVVENFEIEKATYNRDYPTNKDTVHLMPTITLPTEPSAFVSFIVPILNSILSYIGKTLYPRTFSFLSIPFLILIPSVFMAFQYAKKTFVKEDVFKSILPISMLLFLTIYIIHSSVGRYILPISPIILLFFLLFLKDCKNNIKERKLIFIFTILFVIGGLYFEHSYVFVKVLINGIILLLLSYIVFRQSANRGLEYLVIVLVGVFSIGTALLASYKNGQINGYLLYGYNREVKEIISLVSPGEVIWINDINWDKLPFVYRGENIVDPEWSWELRDFVPKKKLLKRNEELRTYNFYWKKEESFYNGVKEKDIEVLVYIKLEKGVEDRMLLQDRLEVLTNFKWLHLREEKKLKNKTVYVFDVL